MYEENTTYFLSILLISVTRPLEIITNPLPSVTNLFIYFILYPKYVIL